MQLIPVVWFALAVLNCDSNNCMYTFFVVDSS